MKILLCRSHPGDPLAFEIDAITRGSYCHAEVLIESPAMKEVIRDRWGGKYDLGGLGPMIVEAYYPCVRPRILSGMEMAGIDVYAVKFLATGDDEAIEEWCSEQIEIVTYSITDLFRFLAPVRALIGEPSPLQCQHTMFCSMFAVEAVRSRGIQLFRAPSYAISPVNLGWSPLLADPVAMTDYLNPKPAVSQP